MHNITTEWYFYIGLMVFIVVFFQCLLIDETNIQMDELHDEEDAKLIELHQRGKVFLPQHAKSSVK